MPEIMVRLITSQPTPISSVLAVERATGRSFAALVSELLWKPMGAEHAAYITVDCDGTPRCAGGLCVSIRDFARVGQLLIDGGKRGAAQIIPQSVVADVLHNGDRRAWRDGQWANTFAFISRNMSYRNGWYVVHDQPNLAFAMGVHGQNMFVDISNRIVVAKVSSWSQPINYFSLALTHLAESRIRKSLSRKIRD